MARPCTYMKDIHTGNIYILKSIQDLNFRLRIQIFHSRVRNKHTPTFINFWNFFQGLWSYYGLKRLKLYYISLHILCKGLRLIFLSNFPEATFIWEATFIPDSRVGTTLATDHIYISCIWFEKKAIENVSFLKVIFESQKSGESVNPFRMEEFQKRYLCCMYTTSDTMKPKLFWRIQAVWRRGRLSPRHLRPDVWLQDF